MFDETLFAQAQRETLKRVEDCDIWSFYEILWTCLHLDCCLTKEFIPQEAANVACSKLGCRFSTANPGRWQLREMGFLLNYILALWLSCNLKSSDFFYYDILTIYDFLLVWDVEVLWAFAKQGWMLERGLASACTNLSTKLPHEHGLQGIQSHAVAMDESIWNLACLGLVWGCFRVWLIVGRSVRCSNKKVWGVSPIWWGRPWATSRFWQCWLLRRNPAPDGTLCWGTDFGFLSWIRRVSSWLTRSIRKHHQTSALCSLFCSRIFKF